MNFEEIDLSEVKPNSILVFHVALGTPVDMMKFVARLKLETKSALKDNIMVVLRPGESLDVLDEKKMNEQGWYRRADRAKPEMQDINGAKVVEVDVRADERVIWVNVDGRCVLRCSQMAALEVNTH